MKIIMNDGTEISLDAILTKFPQATQSSTAIGAAIGAVGWEPVIQHAQAAAAATNFPDCVANAAYVLVVAGTAIYHILKDKPS